MHTDALSPLLFAAHRPDNMMIVPACSTYSSTLPSTTRCHRRYSAAEYSYSTGNLTLLQFFPRVSKSQKKRLILQHRNHPVFYHASTSFW